MATREQLIEDFADHKYATGEKFARLINSMKLVQEPVESPAESGTSNSFIDSISQGADGKITATKKSVVLNYAQIQDKPTINGVTLMGDKTPAQLGLATANQVEVVSNKVDKLPSGYYYGKFNSVEDLPEATEKGYAYVASSDPTVFYTYLVSGAGAEWVDSGNKMVNTIDLTTPKTAETELSKGEKYYASSNVNDRPADVVIETGVVKSLGYRVLSPNLSFAEQVESTQTVDNSNMIFEIKDSFNLEGGSVTIPTGCVLKFNGGKITNGSVLYQNTHIEGNAVMEVFISAGSTIDNDSVDISWFGATKDDDTFDNGAVINKVVSIFKTTNLGQGNWYYSTPIVLRTINRFDCLGTMIWNDSTQKNVDTITLLYSNNAVINIQRIVNSSNLAALIAQGFYADYGRNFSVRGFCVKNSNTNEIHIQDISQFNEGIRVIGVGTGCCYNHCFDTQFQYVNIGIRITQQDANNTTEIINLTTPVLVLKRTGKISLKANDTITIPEGSYLIDASQTEFKTLNDRSYTATAAEDVYIGAEEEGVITYTLNTTQKTITNSAATNLFIVNEGSNNYYMAAISSSSKKLFLTKEQRLFSKSSNNVYSLVLSSGVYTLSSSVNYYIAEENKVESKAIYGGTLGWSNNNFFDNIRHINYSDENNRNVQRYSYLAKGTRFENHDAAASKDNSTLIDSYDAVNTTYVNNFSCEENKSSPAVLLRKFQNGSFYVSRAEGVVKLFKFEGDCRETVVDTRYSALLNYDLSDIRVGVVRLKNSSYTLLEEYSGNDLVCEKIFTEANSKNGLWVDRKRRFFANQYQFANSDLYKDGYTEYLQTGEGGSPTLYLGGNLDAIGFKLRVTSSGYNLFKISGSNLFRPYVVYDTIVENTTEKKATEATMELNEPSFVALKKSKNVYTPQADHTTWEFHLPQYVRDFYIFISAAATSPRQPFKNITLSGIGITYTQRFYNLNSTTENRPAVPYTNQLYWDSTVGAQLMYNGKTWEPLEKSGAARPTFLTADNAGFMFFDTTLGKPVYWNGSSWVDGNGDYIVDNSGTLQNRLALTSPISGKQFKLTGGENDVYLIYGDYGWLNATDRSPWYDDSGTLNAMYDKYNYTLLTAEPSDWATKYNTYYKVVNGVYTLLTTAETWTADTYYKKDVNAYKGIQVKLTDTDTELLNKVVKWNGTKYINIVDNVALKAGVPQITFTTENNNTTATITSTSSGKIYYTKNGDAPTSSSTEYNSAITLAEGDQVKAICIRDHVDNSAVGFVKVAKPAITFNDGILHIECDTPDAKIYYTTDGNPPSTSSTEYDSSASVTIAKNVTVKAFAVLIGRVNSDVASEKRS